MKLWRRECGLMTTTITEKRATAIHTSDMKVSSIDVGGTAAGRRGSVPGRGSVLRGGVNINRWFSPRRSP